ncbi:PepSY domain-containing protein [Actinoplanes sp. NPDC024001]|uniref:PepSY domain-containing protein n=1 Tax=Actinoplanes sp. NPDC024001 TaxID=3154598 RepID=UPI003406D594
MHAAGGGRAVKIERETEHGRQVWDVEVQNGSIEHDIDVDATTGEVLRHKRDDDSDD